MGTVSLKTASGGSVIMTSANTVVDTTITVPAGNGTMVVNGVSSAIVSGTTIASTSGTSIDFTGIPSWAKRITLMFSNVSTNGTSLVLTRLGTSGGIESTGYTGVVSTVQNAAATIAVNISNAFVLSAANAASSSYDGIAIISLIGSNNWTYQSVIGAANNQVGNCGGSKTLAGTLDRIRVTTVNGTDAFDAGSINILYE